MSVAPKEKTKTALVIDCDGLTDHQSTLMFEITDVLHDASITFAFRHVASDDSNNKETRNG